MVDVELLVKYLVISETVYSCWLAGKSHYDLENCQLFWRQQAKLWIKRSKKVSKRK
jgi:hypothetical protein